MYVNFMPNENKAVIFLANDTIKTIHKAICKVSGSGLVRIVSIDDVSEILFQGIVPVIYYW